MMSRDAISKSRLAALFAVGGILVGSLTIYDSANAVIYCKAAGVPRGCVARPAGAAVVGHPAGAAVVAPAAARPVVYCRTVGVPKGCVMR